MKFIQSQESRAGKGFPYFFNLKIESIFVLSQVNFTLQATRLPVKWNIDTIVSTLSETTLSTMTAAGMNSVMRLMKYFSIVTLWFLLCPEHSFSQEQKGDDRRVGCISGDCLNGEGVYRTSGGNIYAGSFSNSKFHGAGKMSYRDGDIYEGEFIEGKMSGMSTYTYRDSSRYTGSFLDGKMNGRGVFQYASGNRYEGEFVNNLKAGTGVFYYADSSIYRGQFVNDRMHGQGELLYNNGDKYIGTFSKGKQSGNGIYYYHDGSRYEGQFAEGLFQGKGTMTLQDGSFFEGDFEQDNINGEGVFNYINGDVYYGSFKDGAYNGCGVYLYVNGDMYIGDFLRNESHGTGTFFEAGEPATSFYYLHGDVIKEQVEVLTKPVSNPQTPAQSSATFHQTEIVVTKSDEGNSKNLTASATKSCPACKGKGRIFQSEIKKNKMVTKDISNGLGPRNFVTYSVTEVVRPAGNSLCGRCSGTGKIYRE